MRPFTIKEVFKKAGISVRFMWETRFADPELPHLNGLPPEGPIDQQIQELVNGYFLITDCGLVEIRYGLVSIMIRQVSDYGHDSPVTFTRILPTPVNMLDTSIIIRSLRDFKEQLHK